MKFRNFIIVLLAVLMAFAFASCKHDPEPQPEPQPEPGPTGEVVYQIQVSEGVDNDYWNRDKIKLFFEEEVKAGDTITLKYRSERDVYQWDIRNESEKIKWVYEANKGYGDDTTKYFVDPVEGEDGWFTLTYKFSDKVEKTVDKTKTVIDFDESEGFGIYFRGNFVRTDLLEIKDIQLNGKALKLEDENITSKAYLTGTEEHPTVDHDWTVKNYTVLFAKGTPGEVDKTPIAEKVVAGGHVTGAPIAKEGYTLTIYTDTAHTAEFDQTLPINEEKIFYYEYVGVPRTLTFELNGGAFPEDAEIPATIPNGDVLAAPVAPEKGGEAFAEWCTDEALETPYNFASQVLGDLKLYAKYGEPVVVTFDAKNGEAEHATKTVAKGYPVAAPAELPINGTKMFLGWFSDELCETPYVFTTPVTGAITLYAGWVSATDVTLNLNYEGAPAATTFKAPLDVALEEDDENLAVEDDRIGWEFKGWYTDAACETAYDYETIVTAPFTLYAKWTQATLYKLVSTHATSEGYNDNDKFVIYYKGEGAQLANAGDILSFRYRSTTPITFFNIRGDKMWIYENTTATHGMTSYETKEDGWTYVTYVFAAKSYDGKDISADAWWRLDFGSKTIEIGDIVEIQDWTFNGKPLAIAATNVVNKDVVGESIEPSYSIVAGGSYEWPEHTVTFESNEGTAIAPAPIAYGGKIEKPADPEKAGVLFDKWCSDAGLETAFNFATPVFEDITLYAKYGEAATVTFSGTDIEPVTILKGNKVAQPDDPAKAENVFGGWYADDGFTEEYDFDAAVSGDLTIYAKWIPSWTVTLNANYGDAPATRTVYVAKGEVMTEPSSGFAKMGYYFAGWYDDVACTLEHNFSAAVTENTTLYAKYIEATAGHKFTGKTEEKDRWQFRWATSRVAALADLAVGDVFTFEVKFTAIEGSSIPTTYRLRTIGNSHILSPIDELTPLGTPDEEGWYSITVVVPEGRLSATDNQGVQLAFFRASSAKIQVGDTISIRNVSYNGVKLDMTSSTSEGLYPGMAADKAEL